MPLMKMRLFSPEMVVDIGRIPGLDGIIDKGDHVAIGALVRHHDTATNAACRRACGRAGRGCGVHRRRPSAAPGHDLRLAWPMPTSPPISRPVPSLRERRWWRHRRTACVRSRLPTSSSTRSRRRSTPTRSSSRCASRRPVAAPPTTSSVDAAVTRTMPSPVRPRGSRSATERSRTLGSRSPVSARSRPSRSGSMEALIGSDGSADAIAAAAQRATEGVTVLEDLYGSEEYKAHLARVYVARALERALARA